jgi:TolB-like protein/Tfp pilus assembly protein PilF
MAGDTGVGDSSKAETQPPGPCTPVFISYASQDAAVAQKVCSALEAAGYTCWIAPRNVVPGTMYADGIVHAIDESSILVLILSAQAIASAHVGREIERAVSKRHPVVALRIDAVPLTAAFEYFLNQSQWIEGGGSDAAISHLVGAVGQHLAPGSAAPPTSGIQASAVQRKAAAPRTWVIAGIIVAAALTGVYFLVSKAWLSKHEATASSAVISDKSIAVLPFTDMSEKKDQEYFADGMAEEIIDLLVKIPGLKVISRTSSFQFKGKTEDLRNIGTQLGVAYVLEGSVRKSGDHLRVTAQLIDSRDGAHLWSQTYDRDLTDVLKMQDEIAASLVRALQIEVSAGEFGDRPALRNTEAYTLYLRGLHALDRGDQQGFEEARSDFERALSLDPSFATAATRLEQMYFLLGIFGFMPPAIAFEKARQTAELALKLDPNNATAHAELSSIHDLYDWDWDAADRELKQALALAPNDASILCLAAQHSTILGRWDEAWTQENACLAQDPLNSGTYTALSYVQISRGQSAEAEAALRRALEISPTASRVHYILGIVLLVRGESQAALTEMLKEKDAGVSLAGSAMAYFALGRQADSDAALAQILKNEANHHPFYIAKIYAFRGERDEALQWLDRAYVQKDPTLFFHIVGDPIMKSLKVDPRYKAFLKKMNLPYD